MDHLLTTGRPAPVVAGLAAAGLQVVRVVVRQVMWSPGVSVRVTYDVLLADPVDGVTDAAGWFGPVIAAVGRIPDRALTVADGADQVAIWKVPHDPALPGLASALDPGVAGTVLTDLGVPGGPVRPQLRAYRPGRRAVVSISGRQHGLFLKVLRPTKVEQVHRQHLALTGSLPITRSLGFDPALGVLALQAMPGRTLREALDDREGVAPGPDALADLMARLPNPATSQTILSALDRVDEMTRALTAVLPEHAEVFDRARDLIGRPIARSDRLVPVHGDFYEAQVLVSGGAVSGLIDVDTFGWGSPLDDAATLIGHLSVYRGMAPHPERIARYATEVLTWWEQRVDLVELRHRIAAVVLSLAPGAFRSQTADWPAETLRRVELAMSWVRSIDGAGDEPR